MRALISPRAGGAIAVGLQVLLALIVGVVLGRMVGMDALYGFGWQRSLLGPSPPLINDLPFVFSIGGVLGGLVLVGFLAWVRSSGGWEQPAIGLLFFSLFSDSVFGVYQLGLILVVMVLVARILRGQQVDYRPSPALLPLILVVLVYLTTFVHTRTPGAALADFNFRMLFLLAVPLLPAVLNSRRHLQMVFRFMLWGACISAAVGIAQLVASLASGQLLTFGDPDFNRISTPLGTMPRCTGLMLHPNQQSNVLGAVALLALWFGCAPRERLSGKRIWLLGAYLLLCLGVLVTFSRSGWLALGVGSMLVPIFRWHRLSVWYLGGLSLIGLVGWQSGLLELAFATVRDMNASSANFRWHIDHLAWEAFTTAPWFGLGVGGIIDFNNPYHLEIHNTYLQILAEMGIAGCLAFGLLAGVIGMRLLSRFRRKVSVADGEWLIGLCLASTMLLLQNMVAMFLWVKFLWVWIALIEASILVSLREEESASLAA